MGQQVQYVDVDLQQDLIPDYPEDTVNELYQFGSILSGFVQQDASHIDSKLAGYLGYSAALVGLILAGVTIGTLTGFLRYLMFASVVVVLAALVCAAIGLRTRL